MKRIIFPLLALLLVSSCASYNASALKSLSTELVQVSDLPGILVAAKTFTKVDCKRHLDRDVIKKGYQPIQLYIQNNTDKSYIFSLSRISLSCANPEEVAEKVHTSTVGRATGYGAAAVLTSGLFIIPAIIDGVKSSNANDALDNDFSLKAAKDQIIFPHSHINIILFIPVNEYRPNFEIDLIEEPSKKKVTLNIQTN